VSEQAPAQQTPRPARRGRQTATDMVRSLALVLLVVAAVVLVVGRYGADGAEPVDVAAVAGAEPEAAFPLPVPAPGQGWTPVSAGYQASGPDGVPTWRTGWTTPAGDFAGAAVGSGATSAWTDRLTGTPRAAGEVSLAGTTWQVRERDEAGRRALVGQVPGSSGDGGGPLSVVVEGDAPLADLERLARAVVDALP
jgi:Protein of unknown function (DUF4245)